jgi:predicted dehydrogenase
MHAARKSPDVVERVGAAFALRYPRLTKALRGLIPPLDRALDYRDWPISAISEDTSREGRRRALENGPYGRCVYRCDNDVVDHQVVTMSFESGASGVLVMHGHSHEESRTMRYEGTRATLRGKFAYGLDDVIEIHDHRTGRVERVEIEGPAGGVTGHGGGDEGIMAAFVGAVRGGTGGRTGARESLESHLMAFAADQARLEGQVVDLDQFRERTAEAVTTTPFTS